MKCERIQTYGRKRARGLSATQACALTDGLQEYRVQLSGGKVDLRGLFKRENYGRLVIEVGFGHGEHLVQMALENQNDLFIGCEPFENGVAKAVTKIQAHNLENVLVYMGDARDVLDSAYQDSISVVYVLFPDPWPKKRHIKRRIVSEEFLALLDKALIPDGALMVASDCEHYIEHVIEVVDNYNSKYGERFELQSHDIDYFKTKTDVFGITRYEQKALRAGRQCYYMTIRRSS